MNAGRMTRALQWLVALGIALGAVLTVSDPARAQTPAGFGDPDRCANAATAGGSGESGLGGGGSAGGGSGGGGGSSWGDPSEPGGGNTPTTRPADRDLTEGEDGACSSLLDSQAPGPNPGQFATGKYDIGYDAGGKCVCYDRRITGWLTNTFFTFNRWFVRMGLGVDAWVLDMANLTDALLPTVQHIAGNYQTKVVDQVGAKALFLTLTALWAASLVARGQMSRGIGEVGTSLVIGAVTAGLLANPGATLTRALAFTTGVSWEVAAVATGDDAATPDSTRTIGATMTRSIHEAFVDKPHQLLNWGRLIPPGDPCRATYEAAVASGPWGTSSKPRVAMKEAGCKVEDAFNRDPSPDRALGALLVAVAGFLVMALLVMIAASLLACQIGVLGVIALAPLAAPFGLLPGRGRGLFWRLVGFGGVCFAGVVTMAMLLSLTLVGISGTLDATAALPLVLQMLGVVLVVCVAIRKRKAIFDSGRHAVSGFTQQMVGVKAGGSGGNWLSPAIAGAGAGVMLNKATSMYRTHKRDGRQKETLEISRQRLELDRGRSMVGGSFSDSSVRNVLFLFNNAGGAPTGGRHYDFDAESWDVEPAAEVGA